jgi:hypothetical protein
MKKKLFNVSTLALSILIPFNIMASVNLHSDDRGVLNEHETYSESFDDSGSFDSFDSFDGNRRGLFQASCVANLVDSFRRVPVQRFHATAFGFQRLLARDRACQKALRECERARSFRGGRGDGRFDGAVSLSEINNGEYDDWDNGGDVGGDSGGDFGRDNDDFRPGRIDHRRFFCRIQRF